MKNAIFGLKKDMIFWLILYFFLRFRSLCNRQIIQQKMQLTRLTKPRWVKISKKSAISKSDPIYSQRQKKIVELKYSCISRVFCLFYVLMFRPISCFSRVLMIWGSEKFSLEWQNFWRFMRISHFLNSLMKTWEKQVIGLIYLKKLVKYKNLILFTSIKNSWN